MQPIQMVDTKTQYHHIKDEVDMAIQDVVASAQYIGGAVVQSFASNLQHYLTAKHVIPCANGTDALQIAYMSLGLQAGDEIITPSFTYIATVEAAAVLHIKPIFVEVDKRTFNMDITAIEAAITPKTKAIVPVHLYGQAAHMEAILQIAAKYNLKVIEDGAQAIGAVVHFSNGTSKQVTTIGDIGCLSFYPSKNLGAFGDGGAVVTNDDVLAEKIKKIAAHGQSKRYYHDVVGCNSRLDAIQAAILNIKLKQLNKYNEARISLATYYDNALQHVAGVHIPHRASGVTHVFHQYTLIIDKPGHDAATYRNGLQDYLAAAGVPSMIYYPVPCHKQDMFAAMGGGTYHLPHTDWLTNRVLSLPMHTEMQPEQAEYIVHNVKAYLAL